MKTSTYLFITVLFPIIINCQSIVSPDSSFGINGRIAHEVGISSSGESGLGNRALKVLSNGKMMIATTSKINQFNANRNYWVARLNADGSLDESFGEGGKVIIFSGNEGVGNSLEAIDVNEANKVIICGQRKDPFNNSIEEANIIQLNADGSIDNNFGINGTVSLKLSPINSTTSARDIKYLADGKIVILTNVRFSVTNPVGLGQEFCVIKLNVDGSFDTSFGENGVSFIIDAETIDIPSKMEIQEDGKLILAGTESTSAVSKFKFIRLNANGSVDNSFGTNGSVIIDRGSDRTPNLNDLIIASNGKILATGNLSPAVGSSQLTIVRLNSDGSMDTSFDNDGIVNLGALDIGNKLLEDANGNILAIAKEFSNVKIARFNVDGSLDTEFGNNGIGNLGTSNPSSSDLTADFAVDGKIFIAGKWINNAMDQYSLVKVKFSNPGTSTLVNESVKTELNIFPNPTSGLLYLDHEMQNITLEILDVSGRILSRNQSLSENTIDLQHFEKGIYLLRFYKRNGELIIKKVLKQ